MSLPLPLLGLGLLFSIALCVHVVRTNQNMMWLWIILLVAPPIGGLVYLVAIVLPSLTGGPTARKARQAARETLDPTRDYRSAKAAVDDSPTVHNRMRLAAAAGALGRWEEAEALYREAAQGVHAEDPALAFGRANALVELGRYGEALPLLDAFVAASAKTPAAALLYGRIFEALGRPSDAEAAYQIAAARLPGLEGIARHAAFMARQGRVAEAREALSEIDKRLERTNPRFRREGRIWRDLAAEAIDRAR
jgi:hypothetical protein